MENDMIKKGFRLRCIAGRRKIQNQDNGRICRHFAMYQENSRAGGFTGRTIK